MKLCMGLVIMWVFCECCGLYIFLFDKEDFILGKRYEFLGGNKIFFLFFVSFVVNTSRYSILIK